MKKQNRKALGLSRETVRSLTERSLRDAAGAGPTAEHETCVGSCTGGPKCNTGGGGGSGGTASGDVVC